MLHSNETEINWNTDESYRLDVITSGMCACFSSFNSLFSLSAEAYLNVNTINVSIGDRVTVRISAATIFGVRHGLETLGQLMMVDPCDGGLMLVKSARVEDRPYYRHRGLLLDTSRNYIPVKDIKRTLDGMAASKLNVLHWHVTDSQSFPLEIPSIPQFTIYGAYGPNLTYSPEVVADLIAYAKLRGIRVIIEIDAPSHAGNGWNWGHKFGLGDLAVCVNKQPWRSYCIQPPCGQLNPVNSYLFSVLRDVYQHIQSLLPPGETMHMGGDEVSLS